MTDEQFRYLMGQLSGSGGGGRSSIFDASVSPAELSAMPTDQLRLRGEYLGLAKPQGPQGPSYTSPALGNAIRSMWMNDARIPPMSPTAGPRPTTVGRTTYTGPRDTPGPDYGTLPPPADLEPDDTTAPDLPPGKGGPGSYPAPGTPAMPQTPSTIATGETFPGLPEFVTPPTDMPFGGPSSDPGDYVQDPNRYPGDVYQTGGPGFQEDTAPDFPNAPANPPPNETMFPTDQGFFPADQPADFSNIPVDRSGGFDAGGENQFPPGGTFEPPAQQFDTTGEMQNPPGGGDGGQPGVNVTAPAVTETDSDQFLQNIPTNFVTDMLHFDPEAPTGGSALSYDPNAQSDQSVPAPPPAPVYAPSPDTGLPGPAMPQTPGGVGAGFQPSVQNTLSNIPPITFTLGPGIYYDGNTGGIFDKAGNMLQNVGKDLSKMPGEIANAIRTAAGAVANLPGQAANVAGNVAQGFKDSLPTNWGGLGQPMGFFGVPEQMDLGYFGAPGTIDQTGAGEGTLANFGINASQIRDSGVDPNYGNFAPGEVGRSTVPAPASLMPPSTGSVMNLGDLWGNIFAKHYLVQMSKGLYTTPQNFGLMKQSMPSPFANQPLGSKMNPGWNWNTFHQGQVDLHDILTAHPEFLQAFLGSGKGSKTGDKGSPAQSVERTTVGTPRPVTQ